MSVAEKYGLHVNNTPQFCFLFVCYENLLILNLLPWKYFEVKPFIDFKK